MKPPPFIFPVFFMGVMTFAPFSSRSLHAENQLVKEDAAPAAQEVPAAVRRAAVLSEEIVKGNGKEGDLIIQRIERPVYTAAELAASAVAAAPLPEPTDAQKAAMLEARKVARAKAPAEILLFTPRVTAFPAGISLVEWWAVDADRGFTDAAAWILGPDLAGTIAVVGDLDVKLDDAGRTRRYLMMPSVTRSPEPPSSTYQPPAAVEFGEPPPGSTAFLMERGDAGDKRLMEPLTALLLAYADPNRAAKIAVDAAALKISQAAAMETAAWEEAHPQPPAPSVIRFYTSDADEIPALEQAAETRRAAATRSTGAAFPEPASPTDTAEAFAK